MVDEKVSDVNERASAGQVDQAHQALVDALRMLFGLLKVAMLVVVVFYAVSGIFSVSEKEVALKVRFGEVLGMAGDRELKSGLHWSVPWPVDRVVRVPMGTQRGVTSAFWFHLTEQERARGAVGRGGASLKPGQDRFVITADANILHVAMTIKYRIIDAYKFVRHIQGADVPPEPGKTHLPEEPLIVSLADRAVIRAAGGFTADQLLKRNKAPFRRQVAAYLEEGFDELDCGLGLDSVLIDKIETPRQVVRYFQAVQGAVEESRQAIKNAQGDARKLLTETAGPGHEALIEAIDVERKMLADHDPGLDQAREGVSQLLADAGGEVERILADAKIYRTRMVESARADAEYFKALLPKYRDNPRVVLSRLLLSTLEDLLDQTRKYYVQKDVSEVRLLIDRDARELKKQNNE